MKPGEARPLPLAHIHHITFAEVKHTLHARHTVAHTTQLTNTTNSSQTRGISLLQTHNTKECCGDIHASRLVFVCPKSTRNHVETVFLRWRSPPRFRCTFPLLHDHDSSPLIVASLALFLSLLFSLFVSVGYGKRKEENDSLSLDFVVEIT